MPAPSADWRAYAARARTARHRVTRTEQRYSAAFAAAFAAQQVAVTAGLHRERRHVAAASVLPLTADQDPVDDPEYDDDPVLPHGLRVARLAGGAHLVDRLQDHLGPLYEEEAHRYGLLLVGASWGGSKLLERLISGQTDRLAIYGSGATQALDAALDQAARDGSTFSGALDKLGSLWDGLTGWYANQKGGDEAAVTANGSIHAAGVALGIDATKVWRDEDDDKVRDGHHADDVDPVAFGEPFIVNGEALYFPGDPDGSPENVINCFPASTLVLGIVESSFARRYEGPMVVVRTRGGRVVSATPNHPVLTRRGWVALGALQEGDDLVCDGRGVKGMGRCYPHEQETQPRIGDVDQTLRARGARARWVRRRFVNLHGEIPNHDVHRVDADGALVLGLQSRRPQRFQQRPFRRTDLMAPALGSGDAALLDRLGRVPLPTSSGVRSSDEPLAFAGARGSHADRHGGTAASRLDAGPRKPGSDGSATDAVSLGERLLGLAVPVALDDVVSVDRLPWWEGHVFTLQTPTGAFLAGGVVSHNCRCAYDVLGPDGEVLDQTALPLDMGEPGFGDFEGVPGLNESEGDSGA